MYDGDNKTAELGTREMVVVKRFGKYHLCTSLKSIEGI
jgi:hypothetical protein